MRPLALGFLMASGVSLAVAVSFGMPGKVQAASASSPLVVMVAPNPALVENRSEVVVELRVPKAVRSRGKLQVVIDGPGLGQTIRPQLAYVGQGAYDGSFVVSAKGTYKALATFKAPGRSLTAERPFRAVRASPMANGLRYGLAIILLGSAWLFMTRRR